MTCRQFVNTLSRIVLTRGKHFGRVLPNMTEASSYQIPPGFIRLVQDGLEREHMTLRGLARKCGLSVSFLSRILSGDRNLPNDTDLVRMAKALSIHPVERLLVEARRIPDVPGALVLMRSASQLTASELKKVQAVAQKLLKNRKKKKRNT